LCFVVRFIESFSFVGTSRVTGCEDQRKNCLICVGWGIVKLNLHASALDLVFWLVCGCAPVFVLVCIVIEWEPPPEDAFPVGRNYLLSVVQHRLFSSVISSRNKECLVFIEFRPITLYRFVWRR